MSYYRIAVEIEEDQKREIFFSKEKIIAYKRKTRAYILQ